MKMVFSFFFLVAYENDICLRFAFSGRLYLYCVNCIYVYSVLYVTMRTTAFVDTAVYRVIAARDSIDHGE